MADEKKVQNQAQQNQQNQQKQEKPQVSESEQFRIRKEKLENLQAEGKNPYVITKFNQTDFLQI